MLPSSATAISPCMISSVVIIASPDVIIFSISWLIDHHRASSHKQLPRYETSLGPVRPNAFERANGINDPAADHREQRCQRADLLRRNRQVILVQYREISEASGFERSAFIIVEREPGAALRVEAQCLFARDQF